MRTRLSSETGLPFMYEASPLTDIPYGWLQRMYLAQIRRSIGSIIIRHKLDTVFGS